MKRKKLDWAKIRAPQDPLGYDDGLPWFLCRHMKPPGNTSTLKLAFPNGYLFCGGYHNGHFHMDYTQDAHLVADMEPVGWKPWSGGCVHSDRGGPHTPLPQTLQYGFCLPST